jgi:pimeloyl-ACP methyl ester carboxylesterase
MLKKVIDFYNNITISHLMFYFLIFISFTFLVNVFYKKVFSSRRNLIAFNKSNFKVYHDYAFYNKQKKYFNGSAAIPVSFESKKNSDQNDNETIKRNGLLYINNEAKATILVCHGFMTSKEDFSLFRYLFKDYNVLTFDFRAHGENSSGQICTFGNDEKYDIYGAVDFIKNHALLRDKPIIAYGISMGAVASIIASHEKKDIFSCAIWDSPFDSTGGLVNRAIDRMKLSLFGYDFSFPGLHLFKKYIYHPYVQELFKFFLRVVAHIDTTRILTVLRPISPEDAIRDVEIPFMLITCYNDEKAPPKAVGSIYKNAISSPFKRLWVAPGRNHCDSFFANPEKYIYKIRAFIRKIINKEFLKKKNEKIKEDPCLYCL